MSKIAYNLASIKAVVFDVDGVLSPSTIPLGEDGIPRRMINIKDGFALQYAAKTGLKIAIITGANAPGVEQRFRSLGITDFYSGAAMKLPILQKWMEKNSLRPEDVAFVGDDVPDYQCMEYVGLSVAPCDAAPDILEIARYTSPCKGGYGVARDLLEELLRATGLWALHQKAFGW